MHVRELELRRFTRHDHTKLSFPPNGVVVLQGANGSAKSSIVEGVAVAAWGKTLRNFLPWRMEAHPDGSARVQTDQFDIERRRLGKNMLLSWNENGQPPVKYETTTKGQKALESRIGDFETWRRTHVFSSQDAAHFSAASDGDRKRLIEQLLGLDRFDEALKACRVDLKAAREAAQVAEVRRVELAALLRAERQRLAELQQDQTEAPEPVPAGELAKLDLAHSALTAQLEELELRKSELLQDTRDAGREVQRLESELAGLLDTCPTCGQAVAHAHKAALLERLTKLRYQTDVQVRHWREELERIEPHIQSFGRAQSNLLAQLVALRQQDKLYHALQETAAKRAGRLKQCEARLAELQVEHLEAQQREAATRLSVTELEVVERILGLHGVRAHVLGEAIKGMEQVANAWMARLGTHLRLVVNPEQVRPDGEARGQRAYERIDLWLVGDGVERDYRAASGGERRRVDLAILLALAEIAQQPGAEQGTLWIDEAADTLDPMGVHHFVHCLQELGEQRCVVVITHNENLATALEQGGAQRWTVADGKVLT